MLELDKIHCGDNCDLLGQLPRECIDLVVTSPPYDDLRTYGGHSWDFFGVAWASDLASARNTSTADAIQAISAGLRGESEPLRRYGVLLDDATLRQEALGLGIIKTTKEALTPQQKVLAAQSAIFKQTTDAQGDFARTSEGMANSQRTAAAEFRTPRPSSARA